MEDRVSAEDLLKLKKKKRVNSRTKGNAFERKVASILNEYHETSDFCRTPGSGAFATTHKLPKHLQVKGDLITPTNYPFVIECKKGYKFSISDCLNLKSDFREIINKIEKEAKDSNKLPLLIFQQDRQSVYCLTTLNNYSIKIDLSTVDSYLLLDNKYLVIPLSYLLKTLPKYFH
jgi:hypothetical protein